jgi:endoglucanase
VSLSVSGLPTGVTASFNPNPMTNFGTTSVNSTMTIVAPSTASAGSTTITVTGTGQNSAGPIVHNMLIALTVTGGGGTGGVTVTPVVGTSGPYFNEEDLRLANAASLSSLSITIVVERTTGLSFNGQYNTVGGSITQSSTSTASTITYQFNLAAGSTLTPGSGYTFAAQTSGTGTTHPTAGDTFTVTYTTGGATFTQTGHF